MLHQTFIHIPGIGRKTERELWQNGIRSWDDAERFEKRFGLAGARLQKKLDEYIPRSREAVRQHNAGFFERLSTLGEAWRVFPEFADDCVYLDIETTGLSAVFDTITLVGIYDGRRYKVFVEGDNLDELPKELARYSVMVTFNGAGFDLRFLKLAFPELAVPAIHIDLRWVTRKLGLQGGLKEIERELGISRPESLNDVGGHEAPVLWSKYMRGEKSAFDQLLAYNTEDVVHLKAIAEIAYDRLIAQTAAPLRNSIAHAFTGVDNIPRVRCKTVMRRQFEPSGESIVRTLLKKCGKTPRIVGIDLTGSEKRASGWSLLAASFATTKAISTDEELISTTLASHPDVVSIDSPLSLPQDCKNPEVHGPWPIYRKCELALKRMGISVFWCLLPTMKCLTLRGMRLAAALRRDGLEVIESYPGAAQDLLGIPRKRASLEELKWGLQRAGIEGHFTNASVTHDEVDAITSALVGLFYVADEYIALGNAREDYLIVPRSPRINYARFTEILAASGLDPV